MTPPEPGSWSDSAAGTVQSTADVLNPTQVGNAATGGSGTGTQSTQKDGAAAGNGTDTPTNKTAKITIVITAPKP